MLFTGLLACDVAQAGNDKDQSQGEGQAQAQGYRCRNERNCYQQANDRNPRGDNRASFLRRGVAALDSRDYGSGKKHED